MNTFVNGMKANANVTYTENGARAMKSTNSSIVDLFGIIGALRSRDDNAIENLFSNAYAEDALLATKMSFYARNVRGGLGERRVSRVIWKWLAQVHPEVMRKNLQYIPMFGRWDDLYCLMGTPVEKDMWNLIRIQFEEDYKNYKAGKSVTLMAKWLKNPNSKNGDIARMGMRTARALHMSDKEFRIAMKELRAYLGVVEVNMSSRNFCGIDYSAVSSKAMIRYRNAFARHDNDGFDAYLDSLRNGESHINAATLYPYDIIERYEVESAWHGHHLCCNADYDEVLEQAWKALPNYVDGENNVLVMADTSGSMRGRPLMTSVGLALYFAERNKGDYKDVFMTFSNDPQFVEVKGDTLRSRICSVEAVVENTNIEAAFERILDVAVQNHTPEKDMPKALVIISDMEFDAADYYSSPNYYEIMRQMFEDKGYTLPTIVFWNVNSRHDVFHVSCDKPGVMLASGQSVSVFKSVMNNIGKTPYQAVLDVLNSEDYAMITL